MRLATRCPGHGLKGLEFCARPVAAQVVASVAVSVTGKEADEMADGVSNVDMSAKVRSSDMRLSLSWRPSAADLAEVLFISVSLVVDLNTLLFVMFINTRLTHACFS